MTEEYFDIVDENNQPLGVTKSRREAHANGDWHRVVHIYVTNSKGEYLVHLRSPLKDLHPNKWDTKFGGHVSAGEDYDTTVLNELKQEIGLEIFLGDLRAGQVSKYNGVTNREFVKIYYYIFNGDLRELSFNDNEVVEVKWMTPETIIQSMEENPSGWSSSVQGFKAIIQERNSL